jgi:predicted RNase H-like HicB family nuclease
VEDPPGILHEATGDDAMNLKYAVVFERAAGSWAAYVPDLPGCMTTARSLAEAEVKIREAIRGHVQFLRDFGERIPPPSTVAREIEISSVA